MARDFGDPYDIEIPLRTTWQERFVLEDDAGNPLDIDGYKARGALREILDYDENGAAVLGDSILDLTTEGGSANLFITVGTDGAIDLKVSAYVVHTLSPQNIELRVIYDIELYDVASPYTTGQGEYVEPLIGGAIVFLPRVTEVEFS